MYRAGWVLANAVLRPHEPYGTTTP